MAGGRLSPHFQTRADHQQAGDVWPPLTPRCGAAVPGLGSSAHPGLWCSRSTEGSAVRRALLASPRRHALPVQVPLGSCPGAEPWVFLSLPNLLLSLLHHGLQTCRALQGLLGSQQEPRVGRSACW